MPYQSMIERLERLRSRRNPKESPMNQMTLERLRRETPTEYWSHITREQLDRDKLRRKRIAERMQIGLAQANAVCRIRMIITPWFPDEFGNQTRIIRAAE